MLLKGTKILVLIGLIFFSQFTEAQIAEGGMPKSYVHEQIEDESNIHNYDLDVPNVSSLVLSDVQDNRSDAMWRDAVAIDVNLSVDVLAAEDWYDLGSNGKVWKIQLTAEGAHSLELNFDQFWLPEGAQLYIYNPDHTEHIGAFTHNNNKLTGIFSTGMIQGESCIIEYSEPTSVVGLPQIRIKDVAYRYRDILRLETGGGSQDCEVDMACVEGLGWQDVARSVVRIRSRIGDDFFWSTGTLMNNTANDCKPYILTSMRNAIHPRTNEFASNQDAGYFRFYFDYERSECGEGMGAVNSISGAYMRATSNDDGGLSGSDFLLMELTADVPQSYNPHYAGWNAMQDPMANSGVCIHHPMGDVKKISTFNVEPSSSAWGIQGTHWKVVWAETSTGYGVTEVSSTGSPLFDSQGRVFATLTGGGSSCDSSLPGANDNPDYFGKMSKHWLENPNPIPHKLSKWLDPANTGATTKPGSDFPCAVGVVELSEDKPFMVYPNPISSQEVLNIKVDEEGVIQLTDPLGKVVFSDVVSVGQNMEVNLSNLNAGIYHISFYQNTQFFSTPLVILE